MGKITKDNDIGIKLINEIQNALYSKRINVLLGSGVSKPGMPLMRDIEESDPKERNRILLETIVNNNKELLDSEELTGDLKITYDMYYEFLSILNRYMKQSNSRQIPKRINIFTTNYDLFIEKAVDDLSKTEMLIFNDGAEGYFNRMLDGGNYNMTVAYKGIFDNYINEIPSINLLKPHGSVNWEKKDDEILVRNEVVKKPVCVNPTGVEAGETFTYNHFFDILRIFQNELDKEQSILLIAGFSFQDKHICKMIIRALKNMELKVYAFAYNDGDYDHYLRNLGIKEKDNFVIITPECLINYPDLTKETIIDGSETKIIDLECINRILKYGE